jgi:hypothetical protein
MRKTLILVILIALTLHTSAQRTAYQDELIGWRVMFKTDSTTKPTVYDNRVISVKQSRTAGMLRQWMQQSYTPKGGLGDIRKRAIDKIGQYNDYVKAMPTYYGASSITYIQLKKDGKGKYSATDATGWFWNILINGPLGYRFDVLCTPEQYYFYFPQDALVPDEVGKAAFVVDGFDAHPVHKKYLAYYHPKDIGSTLKYVVVITKDKKMPYVQVTKGEILDQFGAKIERDYKEKVEKIKTDATLDAAGRKKFLDYQQEAYTRRIANYQKLKAKYQGRRQEPATVYTEQPSIYLENQLPDLFEGEGSTSVRIPIYKFEPAMIQRCTTDEPQWIVVEWSAEGVLNKDPSGIHLHRSILQNFNFDFLHDYFFDPEKVKGQDYRPLKEPESPKAN